MNIEKLRKDLEEIFDKYVNKCDHTKKQFEIGDTAWVFYDFEPVEVEIVEIQDFGHLEDPNYYIFYWIRCKNISKLELFWEYTKFYSWLYFFRLIFRQPRINPKMGPGHAVLAGRNETLFHTREEALVDGYIGNLLFDIGQLLGAEHQISGGYNEVKKNGHFRI